MKKRSQDNDRIVWSLSLMILLALCLVVPMLGGFLQQGHRVVRQAAMRRSKIELAPVRIVLADTAVAACFFQKENELVFGGLRYDVVSICKEGNHFIFKAIPDVKETRIAALTRSNLLFPSGPLVQKTSFVLLDYLPALPTFLRLNQDLCYARSAFMEEEAVQLAGFEWMFAPPPDISLGLAHNSTIQTTNSFIF